jgi:transketolase
MRKEFANTMESIAVDRSDIIFLTGDLGFMAFENLQQKIGNRFINAGVCEQNMISMAAGLAHEGLLPVCYSIAPFAVFRPAEQIRLDVCLHQLPVKIVGNGGGFGYGIMGPTHHAIEDLAFLSSQQNMACLIPFCNQDVAQTVQEMFAISGPVYVRLGFGEKPEQLPLPPFEPIRQLIEGRDLVVVGMGPVLLNAIDVLSHMNVSADVFVVSRLPLVALSESLLSSVTEKKRLLIIEEHVQRGGLGEHLALKMAQAGILYRLRHLCAMGYADGRYGSQAYHQRVNRLDRESIGTAIQQLILESEDAL